MTKHINLLHEKKENAKCPICEMFVRVRTLKKHMVSVHEGLKPFQCSICDYNYSRKDHLESHIIAVHEELKPSVKTNATSGAVQKEKELFDL